MFISFPIGITKPDYEDFVNPVILYHKRLLLGD